MAGISRHMICAYVKAVNRHNNHGCFVSIKDFRAQKKALKKKSNINMYPEKAVYDYYTSTINDIVNDIFTLNKDQKKAICDYMEAQIKDQDSAIGTYFEKAINEKRGHHIGIMIGWGGEAWSVAPSVIQTIIDGFWILSLKRPMFTKSIQKKKYLNAISLVQELSYDDSRLLAELENLKKVVYEEGLITKEKIYQSIYLKLILALSNQLPLNNRAPALSPTYAAANQASTIMSHVFNIEQKNSKAPKSFDEIDFIQCKQFRLYKLRY